LSSFGIWYYINELNILKALKMINMLKITKQSTIVGCDCSWFMKSNEKSMMEQYLFILGGKILCVRCNATSKRTKQQCMAPAIKGKAKCRTHGGKSTGPKTAEGKARCTEAKTVHGWESRQGRIERGEAMKRLRNLEEIGHELGFMVGARIPGRKPNYEQP
jgi:hypothetical protein